MVNPSIVRSDMAVRAKKMFRNKNVILWLVVVPVILTLVGQIMIAMLESEDTVTVYVQDLDGDSTFGSIILEELDENFDVVEVDYRLDTQTAIQELFGSASAHRTVIFLVIPNDFDIYVLSEFTHGEFQAKLDSEGAEFIISLLSAGSPDYNDGMPHVAIRPPAEDSDSPLDAYRSMVDGDLFQTYLSTQIVAILMVVTNGLVMASLCTERSNRISTINRYTKMGRSDLVISLMIFNLLPAFVCLLVVSVICYPLHRIDMNLYFIPCCVLVSFCSTALALLLSELAKDPQSCNMASIAVTLPMVLLSGTLIPDALLPDWFAAVSELIPLTYMVGVLDIGLNLGVDAILNVAVLIMLTLLFLGSWYLLNLRSLNDRKL